MIKKLSAVLLVLFLLVPLTPVFAEGEALLSEIRLTSPVPKRKGTAEAMDAPVIEKVVFIKEEETLEFPAELIRFAWTGANGEAAANAFQAGEVLTLTAQIAVKTEEDWFLAEDAEAFVNGAPAQLGILETEGKTLISVSVSMTVEAGDISPEVRVFADDQTVRPFNGEETQIAVRILDPIEGAKYMYQWYRDGIALEGKTDASLSVRNVSDSGTYSCTVLAALGEKTAAVSSETLTVTITPMNVTLTLDDAEKNVGDPDPRFTYATDPEVPDYLIGAPARVQGEVEGTYEIMVGTLSFGDEAKGNYILMVKNGTLTIRGKGSVAYAPADAIADESYIHGKNSSRIKIRMSKGSAPENTRFHLTPASDEAEDAIRAKGGDEVLKLFAISLVDQDSREAALLPGAHLKVQIPLTAEEEGTSDYIYPVQYDPEKREIFRYESEVVLIGDVKYISFETEAMLPTALLRSPVPVEHLEPGEAPGEPVKPAGTWVWVVVLVPAVLAIGVICFAVIWNRKKNRAPAPPKSTPPKTAAPKNTPPQPHSAAPEKKEETPPQNAGEKPKEEPRKKKIVSFDDLDD